MDFKKNRKKKGEFMEKQDYRKQELKTLNNIANTLLSNPSASVKAANRFLRKMISGKEYNRQSAESGVESCESLDIIMCNVPKRKWYASAAKELISAYIYLFELISNWDYSKIDDKPKIIYENYRNRAKKEVSDGF